tara:strand:- start:54 stop:338 length:285 start_codon:yes stop_codon:yes gene_type:complete
MEHWVYLIAGVLVIFPILSTISSTLSTLSKRLFNFGSPNLDEIPTFLQDNQRIAEIFHTCSFCSGLIAPKENYYIHIRGVEKGLISCNICYLIT